MSLYNQLSATKITVLINGEPFLCLSDTSLASLLNYLDFDFRQIIVEYNNEIIIKELLHQIKLQHDDIIEIVTIVGGG